MRDVDGPGAAMFGVGGAFKCYQPDFAWPPGSLTPGVITAGGGGLIQDTCGMRRTCGMCGMCSAGARHC